MIDKINKFLNKPENILLILLSLLIILLTFILFLGDFNLIKILIFVSLIFVVFSMITLIYLLRIPKEEKINLFMVFQNFLDYLLEGVAIYDENFKIIFVNNALAKLVGLSKSDFNNLTVDELMLKNPKYEMLANIFFPFINNTSLTILNKDPEKIKVTFASPNEKHLIISYFDLELDKPYKLRIVLDITESTIEEQRRLEYLRLASHNLLTPLNQLRWYLESMNLEELSETNKEAVRSSLSILKTLLIFTDSIINFVKIETGGFALKVEEINCEEIFLNILELLKEKIAQKKLKVNLEITEGENKALGDKGLIFAALYSLTENAVIYNKNGGFVNIILKKMPKRPYLEIIIQDTGIGMDKNDLDNLFKKYYRGKRARELALTGYGIGLYNAKMIIDLHGGDISIDSKVDQGTKITLHLPLDINLIPHEIKEKNDS